MDEKRPIGKLDYAIIILLGVICLVCLTGVLIYFLKSAAAKREMEDVRDAYVTENESSDGTGQTGTDSGKTDVSTQGDSTNVVPENDAETINYVTIDGVVYPDFTGLDIPDRKVDIVGIQQQENSDVYAWIYIPNTKVDYPILQHSTDNDYYLNHDIAGNKVSAGSIFTQNYNDKDFNDNHTVIYGHNMKNGSMFKALHYYMEKDFFQKNPYVYVYLAGETRVYEIFGAYEYSDAHLLLNYNTEEPEVFAEYIAEIEAMSDKEGNFNRNVDISGEDKIITLSTCIGGKPDKRYLVQAKLIAVECK